MDGYCVHGAYVGGCGIDWICGYCEDGVTGAEYRAMLTERRTRFAREQGNTVQRMMGALLAQGVSATRLVEAIDNAYGNR